MNLLRPRIIPRGGTPPAEVMRLGTRFRRARLARKGAGYRGRLQEELPLERAPFQPWRQRDRRAPDGVALATGVDHDRGVLLRSRPRLLRGEAEVVGPRARKPRHRGANVDRERGARAVAQARGVAERLRAEVDGDLRRAAEL